MDIRLRHRPHANLGVRTGGITPTDPYLEWCWTPVAGPTTVALIRRVAELTAADGEARLPVQELGRLLGLGTSDTPTHNDKLLRSMERAEQFGLAFTTVGAHGDAITFGVYDHVALLPHRLVRKLPEVARQRHVAAVERTNQLLTEAGLPTLRSLQPSDGLVVSAGGPGGQRGPAHRVRTQAPTPARAATHAVSPTARLDAAATATAPSASLDRSL